ncbi:beta-lactamase-like protein [Mycena sanguinolenta]|nr:beta-lactamase-like protein [Mycena sanguinolenta]
MTSPVEVIFLGISSLPRPLNHFSSNAQARERPAAFHTLVLNSYLLAPFFTSFIVDGSAEGKKNIRRNTSAVVRMPGKQGSVTVLIDCGKDFQAAALEWFPQFGLRQIDAVLLTHAHSDAINGLDDLRAWTLSSRIQPHIDIYVSEETYRNIERTFPYLVSKEFASGGGDIPEFVWHVCIDNAKSFEINNTSILVTPFLVHHGRLFSQTSTPAAPGLEVDNAPKKEIVQPYMCFAFRIQEDLVYISDCGAIPDDAWSALFPASGRQLPVCILDCLELRTHPSHFGLEQSVEAARKIGAKRTYLLGFSHKLAHDEYVKIGKVIGGAAVPMDLTENEANGMELIGKGDPIWVRPAHDGLKIEIFPDQKVTDRTYG